MSTKKKLLVVFTTLVAVVAIVAISVMATVAYLTSSSAVSNVFTIGDVGIVFDETAVNSDGEATGEARRDANTYHLVPGKRYIKDPTVHVDATSVDSYLFIIARNDLAAAEETDGDAKTMAEQALELGWKVYTPTDTNDRPVTGNVYVYCGGQHDDANGGLAVPVVANKSYKMFDYFQVDEDANVSLYSAAKITLSAYAIQIDGFGSEEQIGSQESLDLAWDAIIEHFPIITFGNANA